MEQQSWETFRATGLLWFVNRLLHLFGWAIVMVLEDDGSLRQVYPARVAFRGFSEADEHEGFAQVTGYLATESPRLLRDCLAVSGKEGGPADALP